MGLIFSKKPVFSALGPSRIGSHIGQHDHKVLEANAHKVQSQRFPLEMRQDGRQSEKKQLVTEDWSSKPQHNEIICKYMKHIN